MRLITTLLLTICSTVAFAGPEKAGPKLYIFDCGSLTFNDVSSFGLTNDETDVREMFVPCYLIEHEQGRLLWDAGLPLGLVGQGDVELQPGANMRYEKSVIDQLSELELKPSDIDYIALSHHHFDHAGAANAFKEATVLIQHSEYVAAFEQAEANPVFDKSLYAELADSNKVILGGDYDVFGDRSVQIISAPGHTPGHQVLLLRLDNYGPLMITGDLYHFRASRKLKRTPEFNTDSAQTLRSMEKVEARLESEGATLWIEHDRKLADTLSRSPEYYD